ncbi:hypothetical protein D3C75_672610 [compost metagenome]
MDTIEVGGIPADCFIFSGGRQLSNNLRQLLQELLRSPVGHQELQAGMMALLPVAVITENGHNTNRHLQHVLRAYEYVQPFGQMGFGGQSASHPHMEACHFLAVDHLHSRCISQVIDFRMGGIVYIAGNGHFEFAGKIGEIPVQNEEIIHLVHQILRIQHLIGIDPGQGIADNSAGAVAAGFVGIETNRLQTFEDVRQMLHLEPVELYGLAGGNVQQIAPVIPGDAGQNPGLLGIDDAGVNAHPHHKVAVTGLLLVDSGPFEPVQVILGNRRISACCIFLNNGTNDIQTVFFKLDQLDLV